MRQDHRRMRRGRTVTVYDAVHMYDRQCMFCGKFFRGPNRGFWPAHLGFPASHSICPQCRKAGGMRNRGIIPYGLWRNRVGRRAQRNKRTREQAKRRRGR